MWGWQRAACRVAPLCGPGLWARQPNPVGLSQSSDVVLFLPAYIPHSGNPQPSSSPLQTHALCPSARCCVERHHQWAPFLCFSSPSHKLRLFPLSFPSSFREHFLIKNNFYTRYSDYDFSHIILNPPRSPHRSNPWPCPVSQTKRQTN